MMETGMPFVTPFTEFDASVANAVEHEPLEAYVVKLPTPMFYKKDLLFQCSLQACKKERQRKRYKNPVHYIL
jgi:hypothetical protein